MHDLSLYLLDLLENSLRAEASRVLTRVTIDHAGDRLSITVDDDGHGLTVTPAQALDPFYTTKTGKKTGLGLSLFREAVEAADGALTVQDSTALGGVSVGAVMGLTHIDRPPLGDVVTTLVVMAATHPEVEFRIDVRDDSEHVVLTGADLIAAGPDAERCARILANASTPAVESL